MTVNGNFEFLQEIQDKIGYVFSDATLLVRAFTHNSFERDSAKNYQALEFLGDSILGFVVAERLLELLPERDEGTLSKIRAGVVSSRPLAAAVFALGLNRYLRLGKGEIKQEIFKNEKVCSDVFESLAAAIYLDGGMSAARSFVLNILGESISDAITQHDEGSDDPMSTLKEYCDKQGLSLEWQALPFAQGEDESSFRFGAFVNGELWGQGEGSSKGRAKRAAAYATLARIK